MSTDPEIGTASSSTDASITLVNGQRIRVRPPPYDPDVYDDVGESKESNLLTSPFEINNLIDQQNQKGVNKIKRSIEKQTASKTTCDTQRDLKQTLRCKSILKKRCNSYTEPDFQGSLAKRNDISLRRKSGSHFYLPLPRKKVQFLVEHHLENGSTYEFPSENVLSPCNVGEITPNSNEKETTIINYENISSENIKQNEDEPYQEVNVQLENNKMLSCNESNVQTCNLRRSTSERINQEQAKVVFFDTMALRVKPPKNDARELFSINDLERLDGVEKSRKINAKKMSVHKNFTTNQILKSCTTDENNKNCNMKAFEKVVAKQQSRNMEVFINQVVKLKEQCECIEVNEKKTCDPNSSIITHLETKNDLSEKINVKLERTINSMIITDSPPLAPPRKRSNGKQPLINKNDGNKTNYESFSNVTLDESVDKIFSLNILTNDIKSPPVDEQNVKMDFQNQFLTSEMYSNVSVSEEKPNNLNKTIVQLTSSSTSPVHKVQIKNEFPDPSNIQRISVLENPQRKTSILITGDDCYSTVNVNDDVPLYQSSVVVKDQNDICIPIINKKSSSIYITGSFVNNDLGNFNFEKSSKDQSIANTIDTSNAFNFTKDIHKDYTPLSEKDRPSTPEMLRQLLRDPVEAVKLNLVPHVCGKSGTPKRPRDKKINKYYPMFSVNTSVLENIGYKKHSLEDIPKPKNVENCMADDQCSEHSSSTQYEFVDPGSDCYTDHSNRSSVTEEELNNRTKFYELLADSALIEIENEDHHYESINKEPDPIYEEIEIPPPLPANPPPCNLLDDLKLDKEFTTRSIFEGASKYDILSYLVDAKERGIIPEDSYTFSNIIGESNKELVSRESHISNISDSSEDNSLIITGALIDEKAIYPKSTDIERNDSGVGSETSKTSVSKYRIKPEATAICEDCDSSLDLEIENEPLLCRKCTKKRSERKEIIMEIVETEEKYSKDLQIILEEFYQPMLVAGLLTPEQLSAIFLNVEELLDNSQALAEKLRDAVEIAFENGDEDLLTVNMGKLFLESTPMLHAFETYCIRQGPASLLLAGLEKEKELLRIFLKVSQMENTLLRRMNLNSFLMVPVQRVTKYPLLLARLYKVTPSHHETREQLKEAQHKIELHLNHMNSETKDIPSKLWRRIGSSSGRRSSSEMDLVNIKLRKIAVDVLEWNHEEAKFALEGKLLFTQPADNNWRKGRTIKLSPVNALLVINGKVHNGKSERDENTLVFPKHAAVREAALLLVRDKNGRYSLLRDPLYLDRCVIAADPSWQSYFEVQELLSKDTFIFKAEDEHQTKIWYQQLQFHAQGMGAWRKRRNALANIMMNGMGLRS